MKKNNLHIDLNLDAGESAAALSDGREELLYSFVSSINVACGGHAGNNETMKQSVGLGMNYKLNIGAHPSFPDPENFGRKFINMSTESLVNCLSEQVNSLHGICSLMGAQLTHLKPHGALYNSAIEDSNLTLSLIEVAKSFNLKLVGMADSLFIEKVRSAGVSCLSEAFSDRVYAASAQLRARTLPDSVLLLPEAAATQAREIIFHKRVRCYNGNVVAVNAETLCIHGDNPNAAAIARAVYETAKII